MPATPPAAVATDLHADGLPVPRRYWAMVVIALAIAMSVLDSTIVNVALPMIGRELRVDSATSVWVINAYQVTILALLLPLASLGEIVGYRRISQVGLVVFTAGSLACALSPGLLALCIARTVQGCGAAAIMSVNPALVRFTYPHRQLGRAIGINAFVVATSAALGPTLASAVLAVGHWRWLFGINVPVGLAAFTIALWALPHNERVRRPVNLAGAALYAGAIVLLLGGLQSLSHHAVTALAVLQLGGGAVLGALLVRREQSRSAPLIPFDLLGSRLFALSIVTSVCAFTAQMAAFVALPFEIIDRLGHSAVATGLYMTAWPLALGLAAPLAGRLADRYPAGLLGAAGLAAVAGGLVLLALAPPGLGPGGFTWRMMLCGLGFAFFQAPNNRTILASAPRARSGAAGGMLSAARLLGQTLGAAGVAILFRLAGAGGSNVALSMAALLAVAGALVSAARLHGSKEGAP